MISVYNEPIPGVPTWKCRPMCHMLASRHSGEDLMNTKRGAGVALLSGLFFALPPGTARAQSAGPIAGVVKDATGAVLPGVTVEATRPALIERVRSVVTDGEGLYKVADLRPGTYSVSFTLPGFSIVRRE